MKTLAKWDEGELVINEAKYRSENKEDFGIEENTSFDDIENDIFQDSDFFSFEWDNLTEHVTELMKEKQKGYDSFCWKATVNNFGWRNLKGEKYFKAENGQELIREVLPNCQCTFHIFNWRNGFCIRNWHHDSPIGNEYYYIVPVQISTYDKNYY